MDTVSENGILDKEAFADYKQRTVRSRFMHQIFLGVGGATVFGLVGVLTKTFIEGALGAGAATVGATGTAGAAAGAFTLGATASIVGLVGIAILGLGCLYIGANYLSNTILLDQDFQAKKIGLAARGPAPVIEQTAAVPPMAIRGASPAQEEAVLSKSMPPSMAERFNVAQAANNNTPSTQVSNIALQDKLIESETLSKARA